LIQVEVIGDDLAFVQLRQFDQFEIDFAHCWEIIFDDLDLQAGSLLKPLQNVQTAPSAVPLQRVRRICDELQLPKHELRDYNCAVQKPGFADIRNSAIDNGAGVENFVSSPTLLLPAKHAAHGREVEQIPFVGPHSQADIRHQQHDEDFEEAARVLLADAVANYQSKQISTKD